MSPVLTRLVYAYIDYQIPPDGFEDTLTRLRRRSRHPLYRWHMRTMNKLGHAQMVVHRSITTPFHVIWRLTFGRWIYVKRCPNGPVEFATLRFIHWQTKIPVPRPLFCFRYRKMYLVLMLRVHGVELEGVWPSLSADEKRRIITQLSFYVREYRTIPPPPTQCISSVLGGPITHPRVLFNGEIGP
ncbi:hypothetical protein BDZ89DRAFT_1081641 [Hymenopellis radicata]|nr:hypothetical protein BDZ89DRAFT_1081641 [Hymenopellis radicata]